MTKRRKLSKRGVQYAAVLFIAVVVVIACFAQVAQSNEVSDKLQTEATTSSSVSTEFPNDYLPAKKIPGIPAIKLEPKVDESQPSPQTPLSKTGETVPLIVRYLDVDQGDCVLISSGGQNLLIDGGPASASSKLYSILKRLNINHLDYVILTHPDADHCGGISGALNYASCGVCYSPVTKADTETFKNLTRKLDEQGVSVTVPSLHDAFSVGNAEVAFIGPVGEFSDDNNSSLIVRIDFGETTFLFSGDAEAASEQALVSSGSVIKADVLKVGHHGSSSSSTPLFLDAVDPDYAIVSVGENSYGHPDQVTLDNLSSRNIQILRTDREGSILAKSDGRTITFDSVKGIVDE